MTHCGSCRFCKLVQGEWTCINEDSENYGLELDFLDGCLDGERKEHHDERM